MKIPKNTSRYSRQTTIPSFGVAAQQKLRDAAVLVIGAGGLGSPVLLYLVAAGVGKIGIVEKDDVDLSNLQRQVLFTEKDVAKSKLNKAYERLAEMNSEIELVLFEERFTSQNAIKIATNYDLLIDCTDNFPTRYLVNDVCEILGKPYVYGALFRFEGQVAVFNYKGGTCYRDLFPAPPSGEMAPSCETAGVLGSVAGMVGTIMATEAIKVITGVGKPLFSVLFVIDAESMDFRKVKIFKDTSRPAIESLIDYESFCGIASIDEIDWKTYQKDKSNFAQIIDVRTLEEYDTNNLGAIHIPLAEIVAKQKEISKNGKVLLHCQMGGRSKKAIELLKKEGFTNLVNLKGGLEAATAYNLAE